MTVQQMNAIFDSGNVLIRIGGSARSNETVHRVTLDDIDAGCVVGAAHWNGSRVTYGRPTGVPTSDEISAHTWAVLDLMNAAWITESISRADGLRLTINDRWKNAVYWIGSAHTACLRILEQGSVSDTDKVNAFLAYKALVPNRAESIAFWYRNHNATVWTAYRANLGGANNDYARVYFGWTPGDEIPNFTSDAAASTAWDGSGGTVDATIPIDWQNPS